MGEVSSHTSHAPAADDDHNGLPAASPRLTVTLRPAPTALPVVVHVWPARDDVSRHPVLVCCHDWTEAGPGFGPLATALGRRWTLIAPDAPGHGDSPWPAAPRYRVTDHSPKVLAVLDRLPEVAGRRADIVVLGHGLGALTASRLAAARPGVVRHLILEDPARAALRRVPSAAATRARITPLRSLNRDELLAVARRELPEWPADELEPWVDAAQAICLDALAVPVDWGEPLVALLADVPCPITLIHGSLTRGGMVSAQAARRCAAACRAGCETVQLDAGHHPRREARAPFIAVLASVLGRYGR
jgi:pimeloyl-ACP methyl ester carboxylesterase